MFWIEVDVMKGDPQASTGQRRLPRAPTGIVLRLPEEEDPTRRRRKKRGRFGGILKGIGAFGSNSTVDAYAKADPEDFIGILMDIYGIEDEY